MGVKYSVKHSSHGLLHTENNKYWPNFIIIFQLINQQFNQ